MALTILFMTILSFDLPVSVTLTFNITEQMFQMAQLLLKENNCAIFLNLWITEEVMAGTSSIYDQFIILPSSVTMTFNLPVQIFLNSTATPQGEQLCQII